MRLVTPSAVVFTFLLYPSHCLEFGSLLLLVGSRGSLENNLQSGVQVIRACDHLIIVFVAMWLFSFYFLCCSQSLLTDDNLQSVPFLVLGNKIDMASAVSEEELR